jgi:hypothetical protein
MVLFDAGSGGTRAYTYELGAADEGGLPVLTQRSSVKVEPGLSSYKAEPAQAGSSIKELLTREGSVLDTLPDACEARTPVALMATAGMRLLADEDGGAAATEQIYQAVSEAIKSTGLELRFAGTISGQQEGLYGWITANYALGTLTGERPTVGALDLGGASTQLSFVPADAGDAPTTALTLGDKTFAVYAESYLGYGLAQAHKYVADRSCDPKGLRRGKGRYKSCVKKLKPVVTPKKCAGSSCGLAAPGDKSKAGVAQPPLPADMTFYAFGNFNAIHKLLKPEGASPGAFATAAGGPKGKKGLCGRKWTDIQAEYSEVPPQHLEVLCFSSAWISVLLETYGFATDTDKLQWVDKVDEIEAGWALGAALCSLTGCLSAE